MEEQVRRKFANSPAWMLKMAIDMRNDHAVKSSMENAALRSEVMKSDGSSEDESLSDDSSSDTASSEENEDEVTSDVSLDSLFARILMMKRQN